MTPSWLTKFVMILSIAIVSIPSLRAEDASLTDPQPLVEATQMLRAKRIPEACFFLSSPSLAGNIVFVPDTRGGVFALVPMEYSVPDEEFARVKKELEEARQGLALRPKYDPVRKAWVYFDDETWAGLLTATKEYQVTALPIEGMGSAKDMEGFLILEVPIGKEKTFFRTFLEALAPKGNPLPYSIGWN